MFLKRRNVKKIPLYKNFKKMSQNYTNCYICLKIVNVILVEIMCLFHFFFNKKFAPPFVFFNKTFTYHQGSRCDKSMKRWILTIPG